MKTLKQLREEHDSRFLSSVDFLPEEIMLEASSKGEKKAPLLSSSPSFKQMPSMLLFRRITYRAYPGKQTVALYYSALVDKYLSIPFGPTGNLNLSEAVIHEKDDPCWKGYEQIGMKKKNGRKVPNCVPVKEGAMDDAKKKIEDAFSKDNMKKMFAKTDKQRDKDPKWQEYKNRKQKTVKEEVSDDQVNRFLKGIGGTESGGSKDPYTASNKRSSASGKYQFTKGKWGEVVGKYGSAGDLKKYPSAASAPADYQEKIAHSNARADLEKYGERGAVLRHFTGNAAGKMSAKAMRANPGVTADTYVKRFEKYAGAQEAPKPVQTQVAKAPEAPKVPAMPKMPEAPKVAAPEAPKLQNPDQNITKIASTPAPTQTSRLDVKNKMVAESEAWTRKEGQNPQGGLNKKGIMSYRRKHPGSKLSLAVTTEPSKLKKGSKAANRRKSFCARMGGMKKRLTSAKTANDPNSRINKSLRKWNCEESFNSRLVELRQNRMDEGWRDTLISVGKSMPGYEDKEASKEAFKKGDYLSAAGHQAKALGKAALTGAGVALGGYAAARALPGALKAGAKLLGKRKGKGSDAEPAKTLSTDYKNTAIRSSKKTDLAPKSDSVADRQAQNLDMKYKKMSLQQMKENKMSDIRKMVRENIEYKDLYISGRPVTLNRNMAKRILEVYDSVNAQNKKLVEGMLNEDMESFKKLLNFSIKA